MSTDDYELTRAGYYDKMEYVQDLLRNAVALIMAPHVTKGIDPMNIWPLRGDPEKKKLRSEQTTDRALETLRRLKQGSFDYVKVGNKIVEVPHKPKDN